MAFISNNIDISRDYVMIADARKSVVGHDACNRRIR